MTTRVPTAERSLRAAAWRFTTAEKALREALTLLDEPGVAELGRLTSVVRENIASAQIATRDANRAIGEAVHLARAARRGESQPGAPSKGAIAAPVTGTALARDPRDDEIADLGEA